MHVLYSVNRDNGPHRVPGYNNWLVQKEHFGRVTPPARLEPVSPTVKLIVNGDSNSLRVEATYDVVSCM